MEVKALLSEEFSPNRWILVNLAHAIRNLVHYIVQTEFLWIWHKLALSCGGEDHIWLFFCDPPNHTSFHPPPPIQVSGINIFLIFTSLVCYHWILQNFIAFLRGKIKLIFCRHRFLCLDLWPKPWMFFHEQQRNLCFTKPLFCKWCSEHCFAPQQLTMHLPPFWVFPFLPR